MRKLILFYLALFAFGLASCTNNQTNKNYLRINQLGYLKDDHKTAIIFSKGKIKEKIHLKNDENGFIVSSYRPERIRTENWGSFDYYYQIDFSEFREEGKYYLGIGSLPCRSQSFEIKSDPYAGMTGKLLEFMRQQRCGYNPLLDVQCHQHDGKSMYGPMPDSSLIDVRGGWHDAGDQLKYLITGSYATAHMLMSFMLYPDVFSDQVNDLGQEGSNGIPDILDEAKWGLDWIHKLHPSADKLVHQVADDRDHIGWKMPDADSSDYGWGPNTFRVAYFATGQPQGLREHKSEATGIANLAGRSAAAMAMAAGIWEKINGGQEFAEECLEAAKSLYQLGKEKEGFQQGNSYGAPYRYGEITWADDMEWAAAELYGLTSYKSYLKDAKRYAGIAADVTWMEHDTTSHYQYYPFVNLGHFALYDKVDDVFKKELAGYYRQGIEHCVARAKTNPYNIGVPFIWCSNNLLTSLITQIILYEKMTGDTRYHDFLREQHDWLFGRNPWGTSMFTGIPGNGEYPLDIHTSIWALTKKEVPGGLVDGPVYASIFNSLKGLHLSEPDEFAAIQNKFVVYHDDIGDYSTNEPTMDGTAGSMIMAAYFESIKFP